MEWIRLSFSGLASTMVDVVPIAIVILAFQFLVLRRRVAHGRHVVIGFVYVLLGMTLFMEGLEQGLFPLGTAMAQQLTDPAFIRTGMHTIAGGLGWQDYIWVYLFAAALGFATTVAEPALIAVALKASEVSGSVINPFSLRIAVALGVAIGIALGVFRIVTGTPLHYYIITGYLLVIVQTAFAPRLIIPLAYDSGGVTTSTVTVPLVTALGLGLAETIPGRSPLLDGFGLIAFASLFPMITVMAYAQMAEWRLKRKKLQLRDDNEMSGEI